MMRGTTAGLELVFSDRPFAEAWADIAGRLAERPDFYRGSRAVAVFTGEPPALAAFGPVRAALAEHGIELHAISGPPGAEFLALAAGLTYLGVATPPSVAQLDRKRIARVSREASLPERARSLDADFAGARADIASRRARGEPSVSRPVFAPPALAAPPSLGTLPNALPTTLYHRGTLRGGRALQHDGAIVVVGDVNPGAELVASGDIVVVGALRGTAHAGARGDATARVIALSLVPTQLRIATAIGSGDGAGAGPEVAFVRDGRIAIAPLGGAEIPE